MIAQGLWQAYHQILSIILPKGFIKLNVNPDIKEPFLLHTNILTTTVITLLYCCEKMLFLMSIWMIGKNSMAHHHLKKKEFYSNFNIEDITVGDYV